MTMTANSDDTQRNFVMWILGALIKTLNAVSNMEMRQECPALGTFWYIWLIR